MPWNLILPVLILIGAVIGIPLWMRRAGRPPVPAAQPTGKSRRRQAERALGTVVVIQHIRAWLLRMWHRLLDWWDRRKGDPQDAPVPAPAGPPAPAPRRPAGPGRAAPAGPGAPIPLDVTPAEIPPAYGPLLAHISGFEAAEDADLMTFTRGMAAGDLATADAVHAQLEHCLAEIGLDPVSVQGLADYAEQKAEHAQGAMQIWQRFATVYAEVQAFVASGGVLPKDGRWLTGEG